MKKSKVTRSLLAACSIVALSAVMYGCVHSGDDTANGDPPVTVDPPEPTPTDIDGAQAAAKAAADAAMTASVNADAAADAADAAIENSATMQTGAMAESYAMKARMAAAAAMEAAGDAKTASDAAAAATTGRAAGQAERDAKDAQEAAEGQETMAAEAGMKAAEAAMMELKIDGAMKSVGASSVDAMAGTTTVTQDGKAKVTGKLAKADQPTHMGMATNGMTGVSAIGENPATAATEAVKYVAPMVNAAARLVTIGKTLDSSDDMDRLMLVTSYAGTKTVKVFAGDDTTATGRTSIKPNTLQTAGANTPVTTDDEFIDLTPVGTFYRATGGTEETLEANGPTDANPPVPQGDTVDAMEMGDTIYSWVDVDESNAKKYVRLHTESTSGGTTTYSYEDVSIHVSFNRDGDDDVDMVNVTAKLPAPMAYQHIHFGVWAGLSDAKDDGTQTIADLGIGFVQSIGGGMTGADMPNNGSASYMGDWVATVQEAAEAGDGGITLRNGSASVDANFDKGTVMVDLMNLAKLSGAISGGSFSGDTASTINEMYGLDKGGAFTGKLSGGFYGDKAAEAAGIFDFMSTNATAGAFRGAFGGKKQE